MPHFRRRLFSSCFLQSSNLCRSGFLKVVGVAFNQKFSSTITSQPGVQNLAEHEGNQILEDEIVNMRQEFDAARERFLRIPDALKEMPRVDPKGIYVNKNLRLNDIKVYGASYSANLQTLIDDLSKQYFVNEGLYYDKSRGCLMKLDFFGSTEPDGCYFGRSLKFERTGEGFNFYWDPSFLLDFCTLKKTGLEEIGEGMASHSFVYEKIV